MMRQKEWLLRLAISGLSALVILFAFEVLLRLLDYPSQDNRFPDYRHFLVEYDDNRGWRNIPNADYYFSTVEYSVHLHYNENSMRGPSLPFAKPSRTFRILVLGDSFVDGYAVAEEQRVTEVLATSLARAQFSKKVEVIAMGTIGYSNDQELLWLESDGIKYHPDLVILMFYFNDVWFNSQASYVQTPKPRFLLNSGCLILTNVPVPRIGHPERTNTVYELQGAEVGVFQQLRLHSLVVRTVQRNPLWVRLAIKSGFMSIPQGEIMDGECAVPFPEEIVVYKRNPSSEVEHAWQISDALLSRMKQVTSNAGAGFLVFNVPLYLSVHSKDLADVRSAYGGFSEKDWDVMGVPHRLVDLCAKAAIDCIEPTTQFKEAAKLSHERLYYRYDTHWNRNGHRLAARILSEYVCTKMSVVNKHKRTPMAPMISYNQRHNQH